MATKPKKRKQSFISIRVVMRDDMGVLREAQFDYSSKVGNLAGVAVYSLLSSLALAEKART